MPDAVSTDALARLELLLGPEALRRLAQARVTVVGLGAVGSFAAEALARAGVGHLRLVDFDELRASNLNRHLWALHSTLGRPKIEVGAARLRDIAPACQIETVPLFVNAETVAQALAGAPDILIDAIDSVNPKVELLAGAVAAGLPVIACMGAATRRDPTLVRVGPLAETQRCPLARFVRKRLRRRGVTTGITCVYSLEDRPADGGLSPPEITDEHERLVATGRPRRQLGSCCALPGIFGLTAAATTIEYLIAPLIDPSSPP